MSVQHGQRDSNLRLFGLEYTLYVSRTMLTLVDSQDLQRKRTYFE